MQQQLESSLVAQIHQAHAECIACDTDIRAVILAKINKARECGLYLEDAKDKAGHGNWERWVATNLRFSIDTAKLYMRFAKANREPVTDLKDGVNSLKDAMIASGALTAPAGHRSGQQLHEPNLFAVVAKYATNFSAEFEKQFTRKPIEEYDRSTVEQFVDSMATVVPIINQTYERAKHYVEQAA